MHRGLRSPLFAVIAVSWLIAFVEVHGVCAARWALKSLGITHGFLYLLGAVAFALWSLPSSVATRFSLPDILHRGLETRLAASRRFAIVCAAIALRCAETVPSSVTERAVSARSLVQPVHLDVVLNPQR
jgi:hypothetical protein